MRAESVNDVATVQRTLQPGWIDRLHQIIDSFYLERRDDHREPRTDQQQRHQRREAQERETGCGERQQVGQGAELGPSGGGGDLAAGLLEKEIDLQIGRAIDHVFVCDDVTGWIHQKS